MTMRSATNPRNTQNEKTGATKRSVARAKPKQSAASTVRLVSSDTKAGGRSMTAEERKAAENKNRNDRNRNLAATNVLLKKDPEYSRWRTVWGFVLGLGVALTLLSWIILLRTPEGEATASAGAGRISVACLIGAYVCIIGSFIFDWVKLRKVRTAMEEKVAAMADRRVEEILREEAFERAAKKKQGFFARFRKQEEPAPEASADDATE